MDVDLYVVVENALKPALEEANGADIVDYLTQLIVDAAEEAQETAKNSKSKKAKSKTLDDFLIRAVEDTLLDAETTLQFGPDQDISTCIEGVNERIHLALHPPEETVDNMGFDVGATCVAILPEDEDWHEAEIVGNDNLHTKKSVDVCFVEFGHTTTLDIKQVILQDNLVNEESGRGECAMCERPVNLTEHHLIPRQVHARYLKKGYTREFLNRCIDICRQCHSKIHSTEDNRTLAEEYNTLEKLLAHPDIAKYVVYARKQKARIRPRKK